MDYAKHLRVAIYARVSTPNQKETNLSVPEQIDSLRAFCKERGWQVVAEFKDEGISGKDQLRRVEFMRMLKMGKQKATSRPFDIILTRDHSRFGRSDEDNANRNNLRKYGCRVDNIDEPYGDVSPEGIGPSGKTMERNQTTADISQREKIGPLVYKSQRRKAELGGLPGANGTMFGYRSVYEGGVARPKRSVELHPQNAPIAAEMFRRYADGESLHSITKWLNETSIPTSRNGSMWWAANVRRILTNETALGRIAYGRTKTTFDPETEMPRHVVSDKEPVRYDGAFAAIVSQELFDAVQVRLKKNIRRRPRGGHPGNLVRGIAYCAKCGWGLAFSERRGHWYYLCESKRKKGAKADAECSGTLPAPFIHAVVLNFLQRHIAVPHYQDVLKEAVRAFNNGASEHQGLPYIELITAQIKEVERRRDNLVKAIANGVDSSSVKDELYETELKLGAARKKRDELSLALRSIPKLDEQRILDVAKGLRSAIKANDLAKIKDFLGAVVERIEVDFTKRTMRDVTFNYKRTEPTFEEDMAARFPGIKIARVAETDEASYEALGGKERVQKIIVDTRRTDEEIEREFGPQLKAVVEQHRRAARLGIRIEQTVEQGRLVTVLSKGAPLTFIAKWDAANLDRISAEILQKIGSIAV